MSLCVPVVHAIVANKAHHARKLDAKADWELDQRLAGHEADLGHRLHMRLLAFVEVAFEDLKHQTEDQEDTDEDGNGLGRATALALCVFMWRVCVSVYEQTLGARARSCAARTLRHPDCTDL